MSFWGELRRRNVVKVGVAYLVVAWLLIQVVDVVLPMFDTPDWVGRTIAFLLILGTPVVLIIAWAFEITPEGLKKTRQVPLEESITQVTGQWLNYVITALVVLVLGFVVVDQYLLDGDGTANRAATSPLAEENQSGPLPNSVAVLPLENLSPDPDNAYIAAGLHEEILNQLAKLSNLNVISRSSVLRFAENRLPIPEVARELNVEAVMEGSVRYAGDRIRVTIQLIDAASDQHLWSETYQRQFDDIFAIESDIAMNVANALQAEFSAEEQRRLEQRPTDSAAAYELYLQAGELVNIGEQGPRLQAVLDQAIAIDPAFARAHGLKAWAYASALINTTIGSAQTMAELEPLVREHASRALAIDPEESEALQALAQLDSISWNWSAARAAYERLDDPSDLSVAEPVWFFAWSGDQAAAFRLAERNVSLDPLNWAAHWSYGIVLTYAGEHAAAAAELRRSIELEPALSLQRSWLGISEAALGDQAAAREALELAEQLLGSNRSIISLVDIAYGYGRIGDRDTAERLVDEVSARSEGGQDIGAGGWALASLAVGNVDEALEWLEEGAAKASRHEPDAGYYSLMNLKMNYAADPVLERPEFVDVRSRLRGN